MGPCVSSSQKACMFATHPKYLNIAFYLNESKISFHLWKQRCGSNCYEPVVFKEVTY